MKIRTRLFQIFGILLGVLFVLACLVGFAACGDSDESGEENKGVQTGDGDGDSGSTSGTEGEHTHSYTSAVTKEATCGEVGETTYTCSCGDTYTETIPATGAHEVDVACWTVTKAATCGEDGSRTNTCILCGHTVTEAIPATGEHVVVGSGDDDGWTVTTEATCGADGVKTGTCSVCNKSVTEVIPATGEHTYGDVTADADGVYTKTCETCGDVQTVDVSTESTNEGQNYAVLRAEAENAVIDVDESKMNYWLMNDVYQGNYISTMGFLFGVQQDSTASGGYSVGYLAHDNPTLTFTITSSAAVENATITVHGASCDIDDTNIGSVYGLMTAGVSEYSATAHTGVLSTVTTSTNILGTTTTVTPVELTGSFQGSSSVFGDGDSLAYNNWGDLTGTVSLAEGDNTFVLTHDGSGVNFDYIEISAPETTSGDVSLSFVETDNSDLVTYDPSWTAYDDVTLEAENAGCFNAADSAALMETVEYVATGDEAVINFTEGDQMVFQLLASDAIADANITVNLTSDGTLAANDVTMTLNGDATSPLTTKLSRGTIQATADLEAGVNYIELTCASDATLEVDNIVVEWDYVDEDADYGSDHTVTKSAGRGSYVVTTVEEVVTGGTMWDIANATATDDGYTFTMEAEDAGLYNIAGKTANVTADLISTETQSGRTGYSTAELQTAKTPDYTFEDSPSIANFSTSGDMIVFAVYSDEAVENVTMTITAGVGGFPIADYDASSHSILSVNGTAATMSGTVYGSKDYSLINTNYEDSWGYITATISLQAGWNYIVFTNDGAGLNLDCITLTWGTTT